VFVAEIPTRVWLERVARGEGDAEDRRARRTGDDRCVYEDLVCDAAIEAWIPDAARFVGAFEGAGFSVVTEGIGEVEALFVARRA
jgi:hypothetical protein